MNATSLSLRPCSTPLHRAVRPSSSLIGSYAQRPGYTSNSPHESPSPYSHSRPPISLALALHSKEFEAIYTSIIPSVSLGKVRTQDSQTLRTRNENSFTGAPTRSGMEPPVWGRIVEAVRSEGAVESDVLAAIPGWCECERVEEEVWECAGWRCCRLCMVLGMLER